MAATLDASGDATDATLVRIDFSVFDAKCAALGATNETARAELADVDRTTLWRWRTGRQQPSLPVALRLCELFSVSFDELTRRAA